MNMQEASYHPPFFFHFSSFLRNPGIVELYCRVMFHPKLTLVQVKIMYTGLSTIYCLHGGFLEQQIVRMRVKSALGQVVLSQVGPGQLGPVTSAGSYICSAYNNRNGPERTGMDRNGPP